MSLSVPPAPLGQQTRWPAVASQGVALPCRRSLSGHSLVAAQPRPRLSRSAPDPEVHPERCIPLLPGRTHSLNMGLGKEGGTRRAGYLCSASCLSYSKRQVQRDRGKQSAVCMVCPLSQMKEPEEHEGPSEATEGPAEETNCTSPSSPSPHPHTCTCRRSHTCLRKPRKFFPLLLKGWS